MCCLAQGTSAYRILVKAAAEGESGYCKKVAATLYDCLVKVCEQPHDRLDVQIAYAMYLTGLYSALPVQLENNEVQHNFQRLTTQLCPGQDHASKTFNDLVSLLFQEFERAQPDFEDISHFFSGLGILASRGQLTRFSQIHAEQILDQLLEQFKTSYEADTEETFDMDLCAAFFSGLSLLVEKNLLARFVKPETNQRLEYILQLVEKDASPLTIRIVFAALGKMCRHDQIIKLSDRGKNHLVSLVQAELLYTLKDEIPENYADFLYDLGSLFQAEAIPGMLLSVYEPFYHQLLEKVMNSRSQNTLMDVAKIYYFFHVLEDIFRKYPPQQAYASASFLKIMKDELAKHNAQLWNLQQEMIASYQQSQLDGRLVRPHHKRPGAQIVRTDNPGKKSK